MSLANELLYIINEGILDIYHGSWGPPNLDKRPVTDDHNSLGTWFSSSSEYIKNFGFGDTISKFESPDISVKIIKKFEGWPLSYFDFDLAEDLYGNPIAQALQVFADSTSKDGRGVRFLKKNIKGFKQDLRKIAKKDKLKITPDQILSEVFGRLVTFNKKYLTAWQKKMEKKGWDGLLWHNSDIDGVNHDVWLIFNPKKHRMKTIDLVKIK